LTSSRLGNKPVWGCLNKSNMLFRIATFSSIEVPRNIVQGLTEKGRIYFNEKSGFYAYTEKPKRRVLC